VHRLWRSQREIAWFLISSAVFRDGLNGVFTFGGVLAASAFGFSATEVVIFAIVSNVVAGASTIAFGALDDRIGPKPLIFASLIVVVVSGLVAFLDHDGGPLVFWITGLIISAFVGPALSASRTLLARSIPDGRDGELFGLYATTGRAASFLAPSAFALSVAIGGAPQFGILGIAVVIVAGLVLFALTMGRRTSSNGRPRPQPDVAEGRPEDLQDVSSH
jgi:UMF1 family MFS transporter